MPPTGQYEGRLATDGNGNLLADEGEHAGYGVYHDLETNTYRFVPPGSPSHNDLHHKQFAQIDGTRDAESLEAAGGDPADENATENPHHYGVVEDDPHYDEETENHTRLKFLPDGQSAVVGSHTDAYTGSEA
jgi:hypothetical protein